MISQIKYWWLRKGGVVKTRLVITILIVFLVIPWILGIITCLVLLIKLIF